MAKPTIFISYHDEDEKWKDLLVKQLEILEQNFAFWTNKQIEAGEDWYNRIDEAVRAACVAILLVSCDSLSPRFILRPELKELLERRDKEGLRIIPVIVRDCAWNLVEWLSRMQVRPQDKRPLREKKPAQVDRELRGIVEEVVEIIKRAAGMEQAPLAAPREISNRAVRLGRETSAIPEVGGKEARTPDLLRELKRELATNPKFAAEIHKVSGKYMAPGWQPAGKPAAVLRVKARPKTVRKKK